MRLLRPFPVLVLVAWAGCMAVLVDRAYLQAAPANLATDLARYGPTATWHGVYYRGEKIGFTVGQTIRTADGFELQEDARLQLTLLGATSTTTIRTTASVDEYFALRSFTFSLDPGTGPIAVRGAIDPPGTAATGAHRLTIAITSGGRTRSEERRLAEVPVMSLNLSRMLASGGMAAGTSRRLTIFDPATMTNTSIDVRVGGREVVRTRDGVIPAFRVDMAYHGLQTTSWVTDTGDVVREESPLGLMTVRESPEQARGLAIPGRMQQDLLRMSAVVPVMRQRIDEPRDVRRLRLRIEGAELPRTDLDGVGQRVDGTVIEIRDPQTLQPGPADPDAARFLRPEPLIESDAPEIIAEADRAVRGVTGARARAERLTRYVNALLDKKPTVSLPSALDVLRTRVGDCNEHTALYVAMARAAGIPARIAVGLVYVRGAQGAFYYHAWPEVYLDEGGGRGLWLPVDPTLNQFPADGTHLRLVRGGLDQQATILPLIGHLRMTVLDMELDPRSTPILVGREQAQLPLPAPGAPRAGRCRCDDQ
ncbi:MAG: transglutaminase domain-containing protein [Acidobacteria bacterium]|nr:transglutaminase domain-containing protein [Acidobacteriota bacterium]